jgi:hypothetical protein
MKETTQIEDAKGENENTNSVILEKRSTLQVSVSLLL